MASCCNFAEGSTTEHSQLVEVFLISCGAEVRMQGPHLNVHPRVVDARDDGGDLLNGSSTHGGIASKNHFRIVERQGPRVEVCAVTSKQVLKGCGELILKCLKESQRQARRGEPTGRSLRKVTESKIPCSYSYSRAVKVKS